MEVSAISFVESEMEAGNVLCVDCQKPVTEMSQAEDWHLIERNGHRRVYARHFNLAHRGSLAKEALKRFNEEVGTPES